MAKDDWDLDDDPSSSKDLDNFDSDMDFDFDPMDMRDDRKPLTKFTSSAIKEVASMRGAGRFVKKVAFEATPDGYKNAYSQAKNIKDSVSDIYDTAARAADPTIKTLKRLGRLTIPGAEKILPKSVVERLKRATAKEDNTGRTIDRDEAEIAQTLSSIFDAQQKQGDLNRREDEAKESMQLNIAKKQFTTTLDVQRQIAEGVGRLVGYQDGILAKYHRKSLEIQHRHYFASKELLAFTKKTNEVMVEQLKAVVKNTALPNEMKVQMNEQFVRKGKERIIGAIQDSSINKLRNLPAIIAKGAKERAVEAADMVNMMSDILNGVIDMTGLEEGDESGGFGIDPFEMAGSAAGEMGRDALAKKLVQSKQFQKLLADKRIAGKLQKGNNLANMFVESLPRFINTKMKKSDHWFWKAIADFAGPEGILGEDKVKVDTNLTGNALTPASWDVLSRRTLIEVIPGYLSKMLVELETINRDVPPDQKAQAIVWSNDRESFISAKQRREDIQTKFAKKADARLKSYSDELIKTLGADKALSPEAIEALKLQMVKESANSEYFDPRSLAEMGGKHGAEIADFFEQKYNLSALAGDGMEGRKFWDVLKAKGKYLKDKDVGFFDDHAKAMVLFNQLGGVAPDLQDVTKSEMLGGLSGLRDAGLVTTARGGIGSVFNDDYKLEMIKKILAGEPMAFHAEGGDVGSNTTPNKEDDVPTMLKKGEFVIPKEVVDKRGRKFFDDIISGRDQVGNRNKASMLKRKGVDPIYEAFDSQEEALRVSLVGANQERQLELLLQISNAMSHGYVVNSDGTVSQTGYMGQFGKDARTVVGKGFRRLWKGIRQGNQLRNEMFGKFKNNILSPGLAMAGTTARWIGGKIKERYEEGRAMVTDLYMKGMKSPLLTQAKLMMGHYYYTKEDGTKVFIKSWDELKSEAHDIYDIATDSIIARKEDLQNLYAVNKPKVTNFFKKLKSKVGDLWLAQFDVAKGILQFGTNIARKAHQILTAPVDVYVKGKMQEGPRLRKIIFINGGYTDATGNIIDHHDKINGPVYSMGSDMKMEQRLSMEDIQAGLVDSAGDPIEGTGLMGKAFNKGMRFGKATLELAKKAGRMSLNIAKNVGNTVLGVTGRMAGSMPGFGFNNGIEYRLDKILRHLRLAFPVSGEDDDFVKQEVPFSKAGASMKAKMEAMKAAVTEKKNKLKEKTQAAKARVKAMWDTDGDGDVEGSWRDILQKRKEKAKAGITNVVTKAKNIIPEWKKKKGDDKEDGLMSMFGDFMGFYILDSVLRFAASAIPTTIQVLGNSIPTGMAKLAFIPKLIARISSFSKPSKFFGKIKGLSGIGKAFTAVPKALGKLMGKIPGAGLVKGAAGLVGKGVGLAGKAVKGTAKFAGRALGLGFKLPGMALRGGAMVAGGAVAAATFAAPALPWLAGAAAVGYTGHQLKEAIRRRRDLKPIEKLRFLQYGIPINNKDARVQIHYLEQNVIKGIQLSPDGGFKVNFKWHDIWEEYHDDFGCEEDDIKQQARFRSWFYYRFLPVFIWHMRAAKRLAKLSVFDVDDKMEPKLKQDYVKQVQFGTKEALTLKLDPYSIMESPFKDYELQDTTDSIQTLSADITRASKEGKNLEGDDAKKTDKKEKVEEEKNKTTKETSVGGFIKHSLKSLLGIDKDSDYQRDKTQLEKEDERRLANARNLADARRKGAVLKTKEYDYSQKHDATLQNEFNKLAGSADTAGGSPKLLFPTEPAKVNSPFGSRNDPFGSSAKKQHKGIDILVPSGTPVYAAADGRVIRAYTSASYGNCIYILHDDGTSTRYAHLSGFLPNIKEGVIVRAGQQIAYSGNTGKSGGPHLHFEYRDANGDPMSNNVKPLNPVAYFKGLNKTNVDAVVAAGDPVKPKDDMGGKPLIPTPPKSEGGQLATIKTGQPGTPPVPATGKNVVAAASAAPVGVGTTNVTVAPPNLDPLNKTIADSSAGAGTQRDEQITLLKDQNVLLSSILQRMDAQNQMTADNAVAAGRPVKGGPQKVQTVVDLSTGA